ncbi:MAG TPA: hypothetical protein V6D37_15830 [Candidatus Sericytochromatia bacterium]
MINFDSFIPREIAIAPIHPLAAKLELALPQPTSASFEEIREIQQRQGIPGVVKRIIPIDADTFWEYWWCVPDRLLLAEDVELMKSDRFRVESILEKLVWLFGGHCFARDCSRQGDQIIIHDWQEVLEFARQHGFESYVLDIDYMPNAIKRYAQPSLTGKADTDITYIAFEPAHWHVEFLQLTATAGGFELPKTKTVCSCQIWTAKPYIKNLETGETSTRYDLWISTPLDMTQPPWR